MAKTTNKGKFNHFKKDLKLYVALTEKIRSERVFW